MNRANFSFNGGFQACFTFSIFYSQKHWCNTSARGIINTVDWSSDGGYKWNFVLTSSASRNIKHVSLSWYNIASKWQSNNGVGGWLNKCTLTKQCSVALSMNDSLWCLTLSGGEDCPEVFHHDYSSYGSPETSLGKIHDHRTHRKTAFSAGGCN